MARGCEEDNVVDLSGELSVGDGLTGSQKKARKRVQLAKVRLYNLGFTDRAVRDLQSLVDRKTEPFQRRLAAWQLALWCSQMQGAPGLLKALEYIDVVEDLLDSGVRAPEVVVLRAECLRHLGRAEHARDVLERALSEYKHPDIVLGLSNLLIENDQYAGVKALSAILRSMGVDELGVWNCDHRCLIDRLHCPTKVNRAQPNEIDGPLVSVIVPVYNAEETLSTALRAITEQTWSKLEVLIVDDCSTDGTVAIAEEWQERDPRLSVLSTGRNSGPYVARNIALTRANGELVTTHDADDWSHPMKLQCQVEHLLANPGLIGNTTEQIRTRPNMEFHRRGNRAGYLFGNMSSFMFRRAPVRERCGVWDEVRFGADSELIRRAKAIWGSDSVSEIRSGPLTLQRQSGDSLTGNSAFGFHGHFMGARQEYKEAHDYYHRTLNSLKYSFVNGGRPFPVPDPMRPQREVKPGSVRKFGVVIASEFRMRGGSTFSNVEEIKAHAAANIRTGLLQLSRYDLNPRDKMLPVVREQLERGNAELLVYGEEVECDVLIIRYPPVVQEPQRYIPNVRADRVFVVVNQPPWSDYGADAVVRYSIGDAKASIKKMFAHDAVWYPIGPLVRRALLENHAEEVGSVSLSEADWFNIINVEEWRIEQRRVSWERPRIGRHARDKPVKWPGTKEEILSVFPDSVDMEVRILGGAEVAREICGYIPSNWSVFEFDQMSPLRFLSELDVFVYFTHSDWVESFGRVIIEAMAAGVPVILPPEYRELFGDAAVYAEIEQVESTVRQLMADRDWYSAQRTKGLEIVRAKFSYEAHYRRLGQVATAEKKESTDCCTRVSSKSSAVVPDLASIEWDVFEKECRVYRQGEEKSLERIVEGLVNDAESALEGTGYSVCDKPEAGPSGDFRDYWHPAPYWWPNPDTANGLPYIRRDGQRVPGTRMYDASSHLYDRTRIQRLFDESYILVLATEATRDNRYAVKAANMLRRFFLNPDSRMNPHLRYAQVKRGHNGDEGSATGIIETKDFYFFLDVVRLLYYRNHITSTERSQFDEWMRVFYEWLRNSKQGRRECAASNNHGIYYDVQIGYIADYLGDRQGVRESIDRMIDRLPEQFSSEGVQVQEMDRTNTAHYCAFNLAGWLHANRLARRWGYGSLLWNADSGFRLHAAFDWIEAHLGWKWPYQQLEEFDYERLYAVVDLALRDKDRPEDQMQVWERKSRFHPHDGMRPYWSLG